jgi:RHS repeat-associated protein
MVKPNAQGTEAVLVARYDYDVYGAVRTQSGSSSNKFKYVAGIGHPTDEETGLIYMRARYYEPGTGRFVSEDPIGDGVNWYAYCANNSVNHVDSTGLFFDIFITATDRALLDTETTAAAAGNQARRHLLNVLSEWMGFMIGYMVATELWIQFSTNVGFGFRRPGGTEQIHFDFLEPGHHGYAHVDLQGGEFARIQRDIQRILGADRMPIGPFIRGFKRGFLNGLGF